MYAARFPAKVRKLVLAGDQTYSRALGGRPLDMVSLGLIKLQPGVSARQVAGLGNLPP